MKFVPVDRANLPVSGRPTSKSAQFFAEFLGQDEADIAEVELEDGDKTAESTRSSLDNYVQRHDLPVVVRTIAGRLFVEKSDTRPSERPKKVRKAKNADGVESVVAEADGTAVDADADAALAAAVEADEQEREQAYSGI